MMKPSPSMLAASLLITAVLTAPLFDTTGSRDDRERSKEATISALQTQVADLQTQVATLAPTPTATFAPMPTVSAEPQELSLGLELLYYHIIADGESTMLLGEMKNISDKRIGSPYLEITLFDADGNIVDAITASPIAMTIDPGETMPFEARISGVQRSEWHREEFTVCDWGTEYYLEEGYGKSPALELQDVEEIEKSQERLEVEGKVLNSSDAPIEAVEVMALVYLPDGRYAGHASTRIDVAIPAGKTARFSLDGWSYNIPVLGLPETGDDYTYQLIAVREPGSRVYAC